jgi:hypothetical protein
METPSTQNYRAFMSCQATDGWLDIAHEQLASWLRTKKQWDIDVTADGSHQQDWREFQVRHHHGRLGRSIKARLIERDTPKGTWTTELIALDRRGDGDWLALNVDNDQGNFVDVPQLATYLMQTLPLGDGELAFVDGPQVFGVDRVDDLIDLLCDEERHGMVFVAGTDSQLPFEAFTKEVRLWTRQVYGLAQVIVLNPAATGAFAQEVGEQYQAHPWTIRTYLPAVDPASSTDSRRHRVLGTKRLADPSNRGVRLLLGRIARAHATVRPTPAEVVRLRQTFERLENQSIVDAISTMDAAIEPTTVDVVEPTETSVASEEEVRTQGVVGDEAALYLAQVELVRATLGIDSLDEETLRGLAIRAAEPRVDPAAISRAAEQIRAQQVRIESLEQEARELNEALDDEQIERVIAEQELDKRLDENRWLRGRAKEVGDYEAAHGSVPGEWLTTYPESFSDLLTRRDDLGEGGVVLTCNHDKALEIDAIDSLDACVHTAWDALLVLIDYLKARRAGSFEGNVEHFIRSTPDGYRQIAPGKHAASESKATMTQFGEDRVFPVPPEADPAGRALMHAHFKLGRIGMFSPRLYYLDYWTRTGKVYVGYIGAHLRNTQTN